MDTFEEINSLYNAGRKYKNIKVKLYKAMLSIPYEIYKELGRFINGYLDECLGNEMSYIWDIRACIDEELKELGVDISELNEYSRKFEKYMDYCY